MPGVNDPSEQARFPRLLERLDPGDRDWLLARGSLRKVPRGALIFSQSEPIDEVFVIESGRAKTYYTTPEGQSITFAYWIEGMLMGVPGLSLGFDHMWTAEAVTPMAMLRFPRADLVTIIDRSISAAKAIIEILEFKSRYLSRLVQLLGTASVPERLQIVLLGLCDLYGSPTRDGVEIELPLTHAEIAHMVGASRQWVTISLGRLEDAGAIRVCSRRITLLARPEHAAASLARVLGRNA